MNIRLSLHNKMLVFLIPTAILIFGGAIGYITIKERNRIIASTQKYADIAAQKYANQIKIELNVDADISRGVAQSFQPFINLNDADRNFIFDKALHQVFSENKQMLSFWLFVELNAINPTYLSNHGRAGMTYYRDNHGYIKHKIDTLDTGDKVSEMYLGIKNSKQETLLEPYLYSYTGNSTDEILETSICIPLLNNGKFAGLLGADLSLERYKNLIEDINVGDNSFGFILSNKGTLIAHPHREFIGKSFKTFFPETDNEFKVTENVLEGRSFSFKTKDAQLGDAYYTFVPITIGNTLTPWSIAVVVPYSSIKEQARGLLLFSLLIGFIGIIALSVIIFVISKNITQPLKMANKVLQNLSHGNIYKTDKLKIDSGDELQDMADSVNKLIDGLNKTTQFARNIGKGELNAEYSRLGDNDVLGNALLEMRKSLVEAEETERKRKIEENKLNWATQGQAKFGEILRQHNQTINQLSVSLMSNIVDYVDAIQGGIFVKNGENSDDVFFELTGSVAYSRQKALERQFRMGESLVGRCAFEKMTIYMEEVPENYVHITSGLGEANPRSILIVPALLNGEIYAIIELVSFNKFEKYQIEFIEKIGESIASTFANAAVNERTNRLLEQSKHQAEELAAQEEEMRQNLEELQATQEEVERLRLEEHNKSVKNIEEVEKYKKALTRIIDYIPVKVFLKDGKGRMLFVNKKVLDVHDARIEDLLGKSDFDFISDKNLAQKLWDAEQSIIRSGKPFHEIQKETINDKGMILDSTKYPFYIDYLDETGILGVQLDITELMEKEHLITQLKDQLSK